MIFFHRLLKLSFAGNEHFFEHNFFDFLIFLKRMLGFQEKCILFRFTAKAEATLFSCQERYDFSSAPEVKLIGWQLVG